MRSTILFTCLFTFLQLASAQVLSSKGRFSVEFDRGCAPMTINISELDSFGDVTRLYYFFEGSNISDLTTFTYQDPGTYQVVQVNGVDGIDDKTDTLYIEVLASQKPQIEISRCANLELSVRSRDNYYDSIRVYFTPNDSVTLEFDEQEDFIFANGAAQTLRLKGFFANADDVCFEFEEFVRPVNALESPQISSSAIKEICEDVFAALLRLSEVDTLVQYEIVLEQAGNTVQIYEGFLDGTEVILTDFPFTRDSYCLSANAIDPCTGQFITGNEQCKDIDAQSFSPFETLYSTYTDQGVFINLDSLLAGTLEVERRIEGESFTPTQTVNGPFTDPVGSFGRKYYYRLSYVDSCGQILYQAETHPPFVDTDERSDNLYEVSFTNGENELDIPEAVAYTVGNPGSTSTEELPASIFEVRLESSNGSPRQLLFVEAEYSDVTLKSNTATLRHELRIYVPNAFTPNGDGLNDELEFFGIPSETARIRIYNRWGKLIYSSRDAAPSWDGEINGSTAPEGTYLYDITFETSTGEERYQKGTFAIINK